MKLRIRSNSVRVRLKRGEVQEFATTGRLAEETPFPGATLRYELQSVAGADFSASFGGDILTIRLPVTDVEQWASSDEVSLLGEQDLGEAGILSLLVEKDFQCLAPGHHRPGEDDEDTYPHPNAGTENGC